jgi:hypothetical protein
MVTSEEYKAMEEEFFSRTDSLCENKSPFECDCSQCPARGLCDALSKKWEEELM